MGNETIHGALPVDAPQSISKILTIDEVSNSKSARRFKVGFKDNLMLGIRRIFLYDIMQV